jgi:uncharacterized lipoprotein YmbA
VKTFLHRHKHVAIIFLALALVGCLGGQSPSTNFYMLSPLSPSQAGESAASAEARIHVGLETVVIAEYLNRNEIVLNLDNTIYQFAEFNQWAEPLDENLTRVLEENLTNLLQGDSIRLFLASESSIPLDYRLEVDVLRLDGNLGEQVTLIVQWALLETEEDGLILMRRSKYKALAADETVKELVLAKSRVVEELSRDMAETVKKTLMSEDR